jgi:hypothetical protein
MFVTMLPVTMAMFVMLMLLSMVVIMIMWKLIMLRLAVMKVLVMVMIMVMKMIVMLMIVIVVMLIYWFLHRHPPEAAISCRIIVLPGSDERRTAASSRSADISDTDREKPAEICSG